MDLKKMDLKMANMIQLCLADEVMYKLMDEEMATELWSRLETLYMMKAPPTNCISRNNYRDYA